MKISLINLKIDVIDEKFCENNGSAQNIESSRLTNYCEKHHDHFAY